MISFKERIASMPAYMHCLLIPGTAARVSRSAILQRHPHHFTPLKGVGFLPLLISSDAALGAGMGQERGAEADDVGHIDFNETKRHDISRMFSFVSFQF